MDPTPSEPPIGTSRTAPFRRQLRNQHEQRRRMHPSVGVGINVEAVPGLAQLKLRMREAILHSQHCKLRALVLWSKC
eukprot:1870576-Alexandrium_andersonii.AAC.1